MDRKPTYEELLHRIRVLEREAEQNRKAEQALKESEARLKTVLETVQAGIVVIDPRNHVVVGVNAAAGRMIGKAPREILGMTCRGTICTAQESQCPVTDLGRKIQTSEGILRTAKGQDVPILKTVAPVTLEGREHLLESFLDISERKKAEIERDMLIVELREALANVKTLRGLLPICASCKSIRDDGGYWQQLEAYIGEHSEAEFSHSVCPNCARKLYPEVFADRA